MSLEPRDKNRGKHACRPRPVNAAHGEFDSAFTVERDIDLAWKIYLGFRLRKCVKIRTATSISATTTTVHIGCDDVVYNPSLFLELGLLHRAIVYIRGNYNA